MSQLDEFGLIRHLVSRLPESDAHVRVGVGDDTAVVQLEAGEELLLTTDTMVEGVHFLPTTMSWADVGYKCVAVSISDIAAMGGVPRHVVLSIAIPQGMDISALEQMYDGIAEVCRMYNCSVVGGDVVSTTGPLVITSTVTGGVPAGRALLRSGARPGDLVFVTGHVGGSAAGLTVMQKSLAIPVDERCELLDYHQRPLPQVVAGQILRDCGASSCNDVSDGLASELNEIAAASGVRLRIGAERVPIAPAVRNTARVLQQDALSFALYGGEDYQLVGTASSFVFARALAQCEGMGISLTQIGRVEPGDGVVAMHPDGRLELIEARGYNHFPTKGSSVDG